MDPRQYEPADDGDDDDAMFSPRTQLLSPELPEVYVARHTCHASCTLSPSPGSSSGRRHPPKTHAASHVTRPTLRACRCPSRTFARNVPPNASSGWPALLSTSAACAVSFARRATSSTQSQSAQTRRSRTPATPAPVPSRSKSSTRPRARRASRLPRSSNSTRPSSPAPSRRLPAPRLRSTASPPNATAPKPMLQSPATPRARRLNVSKYNRRVKKVCAKAASWDVARECSPDSPAPWRMFKRTPWPSLRPGPTGSLTVHP
ncbi:hypothetical protein EXIGLDRAFT_414728 [Exidia glandulosa HHB12029]|uniref:Uncharacterized protein n=1 Tax=Exidia glandulosa HHB12029 TaxID=1314781 RepID=A0A166BMV4_EXIGL|nr:hypothetical protein EXIGLDRAFT_414728 [Exidia glandulosa HHB12029]